MKLIPLEDKVIVKPLRMQEKTTASGLILNIGEGEKPSEGIVEAVGPGIIFPNGTKLEIDLKPGDKVSYAKYSGTEVEDLLIIPYKDILVVIEDMDE